MLMEERNMSEFSIHLEWHRSTTDFDYKSFDRSHLWHLAGRQTNVEARGAEACKWAFSKKLVDEFRVGSVNRVTFGFFRQAKAIKNDQQYSWF